MSSSVMPLWITSRSRWVPASGSVEVALEPEGAGVEPERQVGIAELAGAAVGAGPAAASLW